MWALKKVAPNIRLIICPLHLSRGSREERPHQSNPITLLNEQQFPASGSAVELLPEAPHSNSIEGMGCRLLVYRSNVAEVNGPVAKRGSEAGSEEKLPGEAVDYRREYGGNNSGDFDHQVWREEDPVIHGQPGGGQPGGQRPKKGRQRPGPDYGRILDTRQGRRIANAEPILPRPYKGKLVSRRPAHGTVYLPRTTRRFPGLSRMLSSLARQLSYDLLPDYEKVFCLGSQVKEAGLPRFNLRRSPIARGWRFGGCHIMKEVVATGH